MQSSVAALHADYCDRDPKNPDARRDLEAICRGNAEAFRLCWTLWNFEHVYDDLVDGEAVTAEIAARWLVKLLEEVTFNPFYRAHAATLLPFIVMAAHRWVEGDEWKAKNMAGADFVKCGDVDLYLAIAYLVGGWDHLRAMKSARSYDRG